MATREKDYRKQTDVSSQSDEIQLMAKIEKISSYTELKVNYVRRVVL